MADPVLPEKGIDLRQAVEDFETAYIDQAMARAKGVKEHAAALLGLNRTTLVEKLRKRGRIFPPNHECNCQYGKAKPRRNK